MILTGISILNSVHSNDITISPFNKEHINPNSYDLRLGPKFIRYTGDIIDLKKENKFETIEIDENGIFLEKGSFILGHSMETIGSSKFVPIIHAKSSTARLGLFVHITADLIDIGSVGCVTFQIYNTLPIRLYPRMRLAQVSFWKPTGQINLYNGKYNGSTGPQASKSFLDFEGDIE